MKIKVLIAASECTPFAKTGGLGDVIGSLPKSLYEHGTDVRVIMPKYDIIPDEYKCKMVHKADFRTWVGWRNQYCGIETLIFNGITFYFIDNEYYFKRGGLYGYMDEAERYVFFCHAVLDSLQHIDFIPDIIHCHDWQTGMLPAFLKIQYASDPFYQHIHTVFTIHNMQYQGIFPKSILSDLMGLGDEYFTYDKLEYFGSINCMKAGLVYSDILTTVSSTYAEEIKTHKFGENLDGILRSRSDSLYGIINGIDETIYDPCSDPLISFNYGCRGSSASDIIAGKQQNKCALQEKLRLPVNADIPLIGIVSRLVAQKGLDLVIDILPDIILHDVQLIILGTGDPYYEHIFNEAAEKHKDKMSVNIRFDNTLAHMIYASSDLFLMPSLFEPCGLGQIISLRYGTLPIVREIGGLKDTVESYNEFTGNGNGFSFRDFNSHDFLYTIERALIFYNDKKTWQSIVKNAADSNFSWDESASKYIELYKKLTDNRNF